MSYWIREDDVADEGGGGRKKRICSEGTSELVVHTPLRLHAGIGCCPLPTRPPG